MNDNDCQTDKEKLERERDEALRELEAAQRNIEYYKELYEEVKKSRNQKNAQIAKLYVEREALESRLKKLENNS